MIFDGRIVGGKQNIFICRDCLLQVIKSPAMPYPIREGCGNGFDLFFIAPEPGDIQMPTISFLWNPSH